MRSLLSVAPCLFFLVGCLSDSITTPTQGGTVITDGPGPTIVFFTATPQEIESGDLVRLEWEADSAETIAIYDGEGKNVYQSTNNVGTHSVSPTKTDTYTLLATNVRGENRATLSVQVAVYYGAEVEAFACSPLVAYHGDEMEISWQVRRATKGIELYADEQLIHLSSARRSWFQYVPRSTTEFKVIAKSDDGDDEATETCVVETSPPAIREFYAFPAPAELFGTTELRWEAYGATEVTLERVYPEPRVFPVTELKNGKLTVSVNHTDAQYQLTVKNNQGETSRMVVVSTGENTQDEDRIDESEPNEDWPLADDTNLNSTGSETVWGRMYPRGDYDLWRFTIPEGMDLSFDAWVYGRAGILNSCNGDTVMELFNDAGMNIATDNNGATDVCPAFREILLSAGTYYIKLKLRFAGNFDHEYYIDVTLR